MTSDALIAIALESLAGMRHAHSDAVQLVPKQPGLYMRSTATTARGSTSG